MSASSPQRIANLSRSCSWTNRSFREDLYYRLNTVEITVPPLRERGDDVRRLAEHFLARYAREFGSPARRFAPTALRAIETYPWPGNVRELANLMQRVALLAGDEVVAEEQLGLARDESPKLGQSLVGQSIAEVERKLILGTLSLTGGNKTEAARILGVTSRTLSNKMKTYREKGLLPEEQPLAGAGGIAR